MRAELPTIASARKLKKTRTRFLRLWQGLLLATSLGVTPLVATDIQSDYWYQSTISSDVNGPLDLFAEINYDDTQTAAPIVVVMHGYSGTTGKTTEVRTSARRLRDNGFFAISVAMRERDGSDGVRDSGGLEIHDIYDAVEAVKADPAFAGLIDPTNVHITGYSGGGGNTMSALTKFPDYFRAGAAFFGMSDYGYDLDNGWYNNGAGGRTSQLNLDIGQRNTGEAAVLDRYLARASNLASKNNPYSEIHLFVNDNETICPKWNDTSFQANAVAAASIAGEFDNITVHIGGLGAYEDFNDNSINDANELQNWPHGSLSANAQDAAEHWYRDRLLAGSIPQPVLNDSDELFVAGYVVTSKFDCWLGDGQNAAGTLTYSLTDSLMTFSLALLSSDLGVTGNLSIDTTRMAGREISVELNDVVLGTIDGGGDYTYSGLAHNDTLELIDIGPAANDPPTLTAFDGVVGTTEQDTEVAITLAELIARGDETDSDGTVSAFVVQAVSTGTLKLGAVAGSATPFATGSNDIIDANTRAYWTPDAEVNGSALNAFTVVARDNDHAESSPPVQAAVEVTAPAPAGTFTWTTVVVDSTDAAGAGTGMGDLAVSTNGTLVEAVNFGTADDVTVNGVTFNGVDINAGASPTNYSNSFDEDAPITITGTSTGGAIDTLTSSFSRTTNLPSPGTLTGLTVGHDYEVQLIASFATLGRTSTFNDGNGEILTTSTNNPHAFAVGTFTATATTQTLNITITSGSSFLNAYQLRDLTVPGNTYNDWIEGYEVGELNGLDDDADSDGIANGIENIFGTAPDLVSSGLQAGSVEGAGDFTFTHPLNHNPADDLTATYQWSKDLETFTDDGETFEGSTVSFAPGSPTDGKVTVTVTHTGTALDQLFIRLKLTQDP